MVRNLGALAVALALALTACHEGPAAPPLGARRVVIETGNGDEEQRDGP